jgi:hypothetical protein
MQYGNTLPALELGTGSTIDVSICLSSVTVIVGHGSTDGMMK